MERKDAIKAGFVPVAASHDALPPQGLAYHDETVVAMMRAMLDCPARHRMDSLVALVKWYVEVESYETARLIEGR